MGEKIKLSVHSNNGNWNWNDNHGADKLLDGKKDTSYKSKYGVTIGDWITFKMHSPALITKIRIRNAPLVSAIRSVSLFIGSKDKSDSMHKLCKNIQNIEMRDDQMQEFDVLDSLLLSGSFLWRNRHKFDLINLGIL